MDFRFYSLSQNMGPHIFYIYLSRVQLRPWRLYKGVFSFMDSRLQFLSQKHCGTAEISSSMFNPFLLKFQSSYSKQWMRTNGSYGKTNDTCWDHICITSFSSGPWPPFSSEWDILVGLKLKFCLPKPIRLPKFVRTFLPLSSISLPRF